MNERVKELADQAGMYTEDDYPFKDVGEYVTSLEKFAALIIRECMDECGDITSARNIEEHFGIEIIWD